MKKLLFLLLLTGFSLQAQTKVGTIDADFILSQMPEITEVEQGIESYNKELQSDVEKAIEEYNRLTTDYRENNSGYSEEEKSEKESRIVGLENEIKNFRQRASVMMQMKRNELSKPLYSKIDEAMLKVIEEEGYTQILHSSGNNLAFADERFDITEKVLSKLGVEISENPVE